MLPTIVGALSDPASPRQAELVCPDESDPQTDPDTEDFAPRIDTVAACIELLPEETTPEDDPQAASAHETRMAANDRLREEAP
ncbi:hypothetical protein [Chenggangzhangella methanolivorans]|uniref:Uncharacterized protein n=2 Tax=Chenggangzhangella methanolivorans TaxID=1437009 RepID=A0A9E6UK76_9HYPH|nr:hypothetical protein [Chenggangzhangella methanolivorans]QZN98936.1 hypothetical protein K6K41_18795 [Chenggangzhangella methanolivorans]